MKLTTFLGKDDPVVLVTSVEAIRLCRDEGYQDLSAGQAEWLFQTMAPLSDSDIRRFVDEARLGVFSLREVNDSNLREMVRRAIKNRGLVALRAGNSTGKTTIKSVELRRLVRQIDQKMRGRLSYAGRQYKLVADEDLDKVPGRDNYEVVGREDARRVLAGLAKQWAAEGDLGALLEQADAKLTPDWRPPFSQPDGLILLRNVPVVASAPADHEPPVTPSQLHKPKPEAWLKIHLVDADTAEAIDGVCLSLMLPNANEASSYETDDDGLVDVTNLPSGTFSIESADDEEDAWELVAHEVT